jgi:hypothetical protein
MSENKKMELWNKVSITPPKHTKKVSQGLRSFTSVAPYHQIRMATEVFGSYGDTWGLFDIEHNFKEFPGGEVLIFSTGNFKYTMPNGTKEGLNCYFPISSSIKMYYTTAKGKQVLDEDAFKKIETDMTTKALSKLGFNADIFLGMYDDNHYVARMNAEFQDLIVLEKGSNHWSRVVEVLKSGEKTLDEVKAVYDIVPSLVKELEKLAPKMASEKGSKAAEVAEKLLEKTKGKK